LHYGDNHKAYNAYSWNTMGCILGDGKMGNCMEETSHCENRWTWCGVLLEMLAVMAGVRAQCIVFTISRITLCHSLTVNWSHLQVPLCVPRALSVQQWVNVVSGAGSVNCAGVLTSEVSPQTVWQLSYKGMHTFIDWVAHILNSWPEWMLCLPCHLSSVILTQFCRSSNKWLIRKIIHMTIKRTGCAYDLSHVATVESNGRRVFLFNLNKAAGWFTVLKHGIISPTVGPTEVKVPFLLHSSVHKCFWRSEFDFSFQFRLCGWS
jgi:hypothetical protein